MTIKNLTLIVLLALSNLLVAQQQIPSWVTPISESYDPSYSNGGKADYILIDAQKNVDTGEEFYHRTTKLLNAKGVQDFSDLDFTFDPSYQNLIFHYVHVIRDGEKINKLFPNELKTVQKESDSERHLYDGSKTTFLNLKDIRPGDILEYAVTIKGKNPILNNHFFSEQYLQYTSSIQRIFKKMVSAKPLNIKPFNNAAEPVVEKKNGRQHYVWDVKKMDGTSYENYVPGWFEFHPRFQVSTFYTWEAVNKWALPLYTNITLSDNIIPAELKGLSNQEKDIIKAVTFVQDEIRYLGFEDGINGYKPHHPNKVLSQRYGDCKDKSFLLINLLKKQQVKAFPVLVNTSKKHTLPSSVPSNLAFNHCIVAIELQDSLYYIDPTKSAQGGTFLSHFANNDYQCGLVIKPGTTGLSNIPNAEISTVTIKEIIDVPDFDSIATLQVATTYIGNKANAIRAYFNRNAYPTIEESYIEFYEQLYNDVKPIDSIYLVESNGNQNKVTIKEKYQIRFWEDGEEKNGVVYGYTKPILLESMINFEASENRTMPLYLSSPFKYQQTTEINLPEEWSKQVLKDSLTSHAYDYKMNLDINNNHLTYHTHYELYKPYIPADSVEHFKTNNALTRDNLTYWISYDTSLSKGVENISDISWISLLIFIIIFIIGLYFCFKIYRNYNPKQDEISKSLPIGGWLILPAIGLCLSPLIIGIDLVNNNFFNANTWTNLATNYPNNKLEVYGIIAGELTYNTLLLVFVSFLILLFFKRRSSFPKLMVVYYITIIVAPILDSLAVQMYMSIPIDFNDLAMSTTKSIIAACIWIPYLLVSQRSKNTFVFPLQNTSEQENEMQVRMDTIEHER